MIQKKTKLKFMELMLCNSINELPTGDNLIGERKYDGIRAIASNQEKFKVISRDNSDLTDSFIDLKNNLKDTILDGEIVYMDDDNLEVMKIILMRAMTKNKFKSEILRKAYPVIFYVFDILMYQGMPLVQLSLRERKEYLKKLQLPSNYMLVEYTDDLLKLYETSKQKEWEGIIVKNLEGKYEFGARIWEKLKNVKEADILFNEYEINNKGIKLIKTIKDADDEIDVNIDKKPLTVQCSKDIPNIQSIIDRKGSIRISVRYLNITSENRLRMPVFAKIC